MNNIYQVIWSYAKQCYVVTSELAKRHGKRGNGRGVRGMRMGVGGVRRGALALGVTAALLSGWTGVGTSVAHAESVNVPGGSEITISDNQSGVTYNLNGSNITFTVASEGSVHDIYGNGTASISLNTVYVYGTVSGSYVTGGYAFNGGEVTENTVTVSGDAALINGTVYGGNAGNGLQASGSATGNKVFIYGGMVKKAVYGGNSYSRDANENKVTIEDGSVFSVTGGYSPSQSAIKNQVTISGGSVTSSNVRAVVGGAGGSRGENSVTQENEVIIKGNAKVKGSVIGGADAGSPAVVNKNTVTIKDSAVIGESVYGGYGYYNVKDKTENKVFIEGGSVSGNVYGGYANFYPAGDEPAGNVKENEVHITGGTVGTFYKNDIAGGCVDTDGAGAAMDNSVTITGGTVKGRVYGGRVNNATGAATGNKLNISVKDASVADTVLENNAYGGYANGTGEVSKNYVTITGGTLNHHVYGGYSGGGAARNNTVVISGKNTNVGADVYGGYNNETDNAEFTVNKNTVKITDATIGGDVSGGEGDQNVFENRVEITGGKFGKMDDISIVMGGSAYDGSATKNEVGISGGTQLIGEVYGGYSSNSQTANNIVTLDNVTVKKSEQYGGNVYGGCSDGDATGNSVTISGTKTQVEGKVYGGYISKSSTAATGNTVEIKGGTIGKSEGDAVFGGYANHGDSKQNNVSITGGTVNGGVVGGYAKTGDSNQNNVSITGGTVNGDVVGGDAYFDAAGNTITLSNCTINGGVYGSWTMDGETKNNTVNLTGKVSGLDGKYSVLSGGNYARTGNELHIGGTKDGSITGAWQGMTGDVVTNKISSVGEFESIVYHSVKWDKDVAALEATTVDNVKTLDITNRKFDQTPDSGSMSLLKTTDSDLSAIKLTYDDTHKDIPITTEGVILVGGTEKTETTGEKGVKLTRTVNEKVSLATDSKAINYGIEESNNVTKITLGDLNTKDPRDMNGTGFDFTNTTKVDASGLKLVIEQPVDITKAVVPMVTNAANLKAGLTDINYGEGKTYHSQDISLTHDATGIAVGATMTGLVETKAGEVDYRVTGATVKSLNLSSWNGAVVAEPLVGVTGSGVTVTTGEFVLPEPSKGSFDIITTNTENFFGTVSGKRQYGDTTYNNDEENGVILSGHQTGGVKAEDSGKKLTYYAMTKSADTMTFGEVEFKKGGVARDLKNAYTFDTSSTINAKDLSFKETTEALQKNDSMTLAANAKGITSANDVTQPTNPDIAIAYTDKLGIKFCAAAGGTVAALTDAVQYTVDSVAVNSIDLAGWDGKTASAVPTGWTLADKATVNTKGMTELAEAATIITSGTDDFFKAATITGGNEYKETDFSEEDSGITFAGKQAKGVKADGKNLVYAVGGKNVATATMTGQIKWDTDKPYYENTKYNFAADSKTDISAVKFTADKDPLNQSMTLIKNSVAGTVTEGTPEFTVNLSNTSLSATAKGEAKVAEGNLTYKVTDVELQSVTVNGADSASDAVPDGWKTAENLTVDTSKMEVPSDVKAGEEKIILKANSANKFSDDNISDSSNKYGKNKDRDFTKTDEAQSAVTIKGYQDKGVKASSEGNLVYAVGKKEVTDVTLGAMKWAAGTELLDGSSADYNYENVKEISADKFAVTFNKPENVAADEVMTLLKANETLKAMVNETKTSSYDGIEVVPGVLMDGNISGKLANSGNNVVFTATENKASALTFGKVEWTGDTPLLDHSKTLANVSFDGATVDTSNIDFYKEMYIEADQTTTLVSDFGGTPKDIKGTTYKVGTAFDGEGSATMENGNLIFRTKTSAGVSEQTHKAVMGVEATMGLLATGKEHEGNVLDGLGNLSNVDSDGASVAASFGGGKDRYETGSHVNINSWSAAVGVGARKETKKGTLQYGIFGEYGKGNYTMHSDVGRSDGDAHYAGGGLMAKWTNKHDVYTEASFRLGRVSDTANDLLRDGAGNAYGYDIHATYYGAHVGLGKIFNYKGGKSLDVYGKFFYTKRDGAEFDAKQHYNLDSVNSSVLRIGARYGTTDKKWNWYGGLAYEYEFDGEAKGTVNGTEIRAASIKGSSVRGEIGMKMNATRTNPWQVDVSLYGYGGKHRGFGGNVNVAYMF